MFRVQQLLDTVCEWLCSTLWPASSKTPGFTVNFSVKPKSLDLLVTT